MFSYLYFFNQIQKIAYHLTSEYNKHNIQKQFMWLLISLKTINVKRYTNKAV